MLDNMHYQPDQEWPAETLGLRVTAEFQEFIRCGYDKMPFSIDPFGNVIITDQKMYSQYEAHLDRIEARRESA